MNGVGEPEDKHNQAQSGDLIELADEEIDQSYDLIENRNSHTKEQDNVISNNNNNSSNDISIDDTIENGKNNVSDDVGGGGTTTGTVGENSSEIEKLIAQHKEENR
eukprot:Pgem_evm1s14965